MVQPHTKRYFKPSRCSVKFLETSNRGSKVNTIAALFLELGILPIQYEIEKKQLVFLKRILDRENDDPIKMSYHEMLKY